MDLGPSTFHQEVLAEFIQEGHFARHIRRMRVLYGERARTLVDSLKNEIGGWVEIFGGEAGMHLTVVLNNVLKNRSRDVEIAELAAQQNLWLWPLSQYYVADPDRSGFVLGFGSTDVAEIPRAVHKLRNLLLMK
jgi:GntR family transcriptional regulator/MocR family aminotransferase